MNKKIISILVPALSALMLCQAAAADTVATPAPAKPFPALAASRQLLLVTTKDWGAVTGVMRRFARADVHAGWTEVGAGIPVVVGRNGLGWGRGLTPPPALPGPVKREGDGKSPAGIFRLSSAFGLAGPDKMKKVRLPYRQLTDGVECVDDVKSAHYNSIVDRNQTPRPDWDSSEKMRSVTNQYRLGIVVDHNANPPASGGGSCIFIHIWEGAATGTSGCTAMAPAQMETLLPWLNPADNPALAQLPEAAFKNLQPQLQLP